MHVVDMSRNVLRKSVFKDYREKGMRFATHTQWLGEKKQYI